MKKIICLFIPALSVVYSLLYASLGGFRGNASAMSKIGLEHHFLFAIWGMLTFISIGGNLLIAYRKGKYKFYIPLLIAALVGMIMTISFEFDYDKHTEYVLHCIGSLAFSAIIGISVFLLFLLSRRYILAAISAVILITDLILLIIYKETAFIELMPIFAGYVLLGIYNLREEKEKVEIK